MATKGKKGGGGKGSPARGGASSGAAKKAQSALAVELAALLPEIQEEGLRFLLNQAHVLIHNQQVEKVNAEMAKLQGLDRRQQGSAAAGAAGAAAKAAAGVDIEENRSGSSFVLVLSPARKFLNREEMRGLVKICRAADNAGEAGTRLYRWLGRQRRDILLDAGIKNENDPRLAALGELVRGRYTLADEG
jgi:hypothetical protein